VQSLLYEKEFDLHDKESVWETHFHLNCFARRLVLAQMQKVTRKSLLRGLISRTLNYLRVSTLHLSIHRMAAMIKTDLHFC